MEKMEHFSHPHPLTLHENKDVRCRACGENCLLFDNNSNDSSSSSSSCFGCETCDFYLHKHCAVELQQEIRHPFHLLHPLQLSILSPYGDASRCEACYASTLPFHLAYRCHDCAFNLHTRCARPNLGPLLKYEGHPHWLTYFDQTPVSFTCDICREEAKDCFFRCVDCEFDLHIYCHPSAPTTINHPSHSHPLTLTPLEDQYDNDEFYYCNVCEMRRCKLECESVYYCAECKFVAEVRCVISELWPALPFSKDQSEATAEELQKEEFDKLRISEM